MYIRLITLLLRWLRVPPEPQAPHGDPASLRVFRAGRNFLKLRLLKWGSAQLAALAGIIFWFVVFSDLGDMVEERRSRVAQPKPAASAPTNIGQTISNTANEFAEEQREDQQARKAKKRKWRPIDNFYAWQHGTASFLARLPRPAMLVIWFFEVSGLVLYVLQLPLTLLLARMDYELRWYMVTDRSLRIRHGVWRINESTMSFANIQQVVVSQGPLQRLLGLSDLKVQSAGGSGDQHEEPGADDMHHGLFHSVTNASEIRDLILERLRHIRESGLGDPDELGRRVPHAGHSLGDGWSPPERGSDFAKATTDKTESAPYPLPSSSPELLAAIRELAAETRALGVVREALAHHRPA